MKKFPQYLDYVHTISYHCFADEVNPFFRRFPELEYKMNYFIYCLKNYFNFSGRATRSEFWYFMLFVLLFGIVITLIEVIMGTYDSGILSLIYNLALLFPTLAVSTRRLHDTNRSGWWNLIMLVPIIGIIVLIVFYCQDSKEDNKYGVNPKKTILQQG